MKLLWSSIMLSSLLVGCKTTSTRPAPSLARIEAVCRWSAYLASLNAGYHNHEPLAQAAQVIRDLSRAYHLTPSMAIAALHQAGVTWISCPEGILAVTGAVLLQDAVFGEIAIHDEAALRAVLRGVSDGLFLGLALASRDGTPQEHRLEQETMSTRGSK